MCEVGSVWLNVPSAAETPVPHQTDDQNRRLLRLVAGQGAVAFAVLFHLLLVQ